MTECALCRKEITSSTASVSLVGGMFPGEDPHFFMVDETVMKEAYTHLDCLLSAIKRGM